MQITIPALGPGGAAPISVLDLEPLLELVRQCRPDAVSLMPPAGPDDLPNCPALLAMKTQLESEGVATVPGAWRIGPSDPITDTAWRMQTLFETRALVAALGEAGTSPLVLEWEPPTREPGDLEALLEFVEPLLEEAARAEVRLALRLSADTAGYSTVFRELPSPYLGACYDVRRLPSAATGAKTVDRLGERLFAVQAGRCWEVEGPVTSWKRLMSALKAARFSGPFLLDAARTPVEAGCAVGYVRGALSVLGAPRDATSPIEVI
jgi:sugar phosphate isomerase/epimerase